VGERTDFFISHAGADRAWAEWVAWQLTDAGYTVELDTWDWSPGQNFVTAMSDALARCERVLALFSAAYFERPRYTTEEWSAALTKRDRIVPVRVEGVPEEAVPPVLQTLIYGDLFGVDAAEARRVLLDAVAGPKRPDGEPVFPGRGASGGLSRMGGSGPRLPGSLPRVWNVPARNLGFTGRDEMLVRIREHLAAGGRAVVQALQGMGGVGKTQLAIEYAHRFAGAYELAWWIDAEQGSLIGDQFAALGAELKCVPAGASAQTVRSEVLRDLRERDRWLLVFDSAESHGDVLPWLPGGGGHVLITSREHGWAEVAAPVEVDVLARTESVALLRDRVSGLSDDDADALAGELGDLPLAVAQAAGYLADTGISAPEYLSLLQTRAGKILDLGRPVSYPMSLAAATQLAADKLAQDDPAAAELANLCAFLAPEPIPEDLFTGAVDKLAEPLAARAADPLAWRQTIAALTRQSLARIDHRGLQLHRLTQTIIRDRLTPEQAAATRACTEAILAAGNPRRSDSPAVWPRWAQLMPHVLAAELGSTDSTGLRWLACYACWYLLARGDGRGAHDLASDLHRQWPGRLGQDHEHPLAVAHYLAWALQILGHYAEARELDADTLARKRRLHGADHRSTLLSATSLAADLTELGETEAARELDEDTLARSRRVLGDDHADTLGSASNLAADLAGLGRAQEARRLNEDTLARRRRVLGHDHPHTLVSASNLAVNLRSLGQVREARELDEDTLARRRRVLGEDHPSTRRSAKNLAEDLRLLREADGAENDV
jgi:TIR domain/Tetratricopeptide repeat/NB-ARC domain